MAPKAAAPPSPTTTALASPTPTLTPTEVRVPSTEVDTEVDTEIEGGGASELGSRSRSRSPAEAAQQAAAGEEPGQGVAPPVQAALWPEEEDPHGFLPRALGEEPRTRRLLLESPPQPRPSSSAVEPRPRQPLYGLREAGPLAHSSSSSSRGGLRWHNLPLTSATFARGGGWVSLAGMMAEALQATAGHPRVGRSRIQPCRHSDAQGDLD